MGGSLQQKVYGGGKGASTMKTMGSYNKSPMKRLGHTNGVVRRLGTYTGSNSGKNNLNQEMYPKY